MLYKRVYEDEYLDVHKASLSAYNITENLFSQVNEEGNRFVVFDDIVNCCVDGTENMQQDAFIISNNGGKILRETTKGWEIIIQLKYGSTTWESMRNVKECNPLKLAEYSHHVQISQEPAFAWWVPHVIKKRN